MAAAREIFFTLQPHTAIDQASGGVKVESNRARTSLVDRRQWRCEIPVNISANKLVTGTTLHPATDAIGADYTSAWAIANKILKPKHALCADSR
jgi:hypothetical protein